jgi:hypothetical protein
MESLTFHFGVTMEFSLAVYPLSTHLPVQYLFRQLRSRNTTMVSLFASASMDKSATRTVSPTATKSGSGLLPMRAIAQRLWLYETPTLC